MAQRRRNLRASSLLLCGLLSSASARAVDEIAVIVARAAPPVELEQGGLRDIYLKKIFVDAAGRKLVPLNLPPDHPLRQAFSLALFHAGADELQDYWNQRYFHGVLPPYVLGSQAAVVRFVARTPGAIGYVAPCYLGSEVRAVFSLPVPDTARAGLEALCPPAQTESPEPR